MQTTTILIIGGGASGLESARILSRKGFAVTVLEARPRLGGRIHTLEEAPFPDPIEAGAEFIHGKLSKTFALLKEAGIRHETIEGDLWRKKDGKLTQEEDFVENGEALAKRLGALTEDMTVQHFLDLYFKGPENENLRNSIRGFVEGYDAADLNRASALALRDEWLGNEDDQYRPIGGYSPMIRFLENELLEAGAQIITNAVVNRLSWQPGEVTAHTTAGQTYTAQRVIITVPLGILQGDGLAIDPMLPNLKEDVRAMGYGSVIKILLLFKTAFWEEKTWRGRIGADISALGWLFSNAAVPTWWTQLPREVPMITGWLAGPNAAARKTMTDGELLDEAVRSLATILNLTIDDINALLVDSRVYNWPADPFAQGAYSYSTPETTAAVKRVTTPVAGTIFFAGEAFSPAPHTGTVEGALESAAVVTDQVIAAARQH